MLKQKQIELIKFACAIQEVQETVLVDLFLFEADLAEGFPQKLVHIFLVVDRYPEDDLQEQVLGLISEAAQLEWHQFEHGCLELVDGLQTILEELGDAQMEL